MILNCSVLPCLLSLLSGTSMKESVRKEACWTISNITAGNRQQIQAVIDANVFPVLIDILGKAAFRWTKNNKRRKGRFRFNLTPNVHSGIIICLPNCFNMPI